MSREYFAKGQEIIDQLNEIKKSKIRFKVSSDGIIFFMNYPIIKKWKWLNVSLEDVLNYDLEFRKLQLHDHVANWLRERDIYW